MKEAIDHVDRKSDSDPGRVEEPISEWNLRGHERVTTAIDPPLATREMFYRPERFEFLVDVGTVDVLHPDLIRLGGVSAMREAAAMAQRHNVPMAPRFYVAVSAYIVNAAPNGLIAEYILAYDIRDLLVDPSEIEDGHLLLPNRPGYSYVIARDARRKYEIDPTP